MDKADKLEKLKEILKTEFGIENKNEFEAAVKSFAGINLGIFTTPLPERRAECEYQEETKVTA